MYFERDPILPPTGEFWQFTFLLMVFGAEKPSNTFGDLNLNLCSVADVFLAQTSCENSFAGPLIRLIHIQRKPVRGKVMKILYLSSLALLMTSTAWGQATPIPASSPITAEAVVARIQKQIGVPWQTDTVDTFKAGDPKTRVTGIAVTMMATLDVLQRAAAAGDNFIITHEPTFYDHMDDPSLLPQKEQDAVLAAKRTFIAEHHLVVWRFHDHWHDRNPDGIEQGMIRALGWEKFLDPGDDHLFTLPETTVADLGAFLEKKLNLASLRIVGKRDMKVKRVAMAPGAVGFAKQAEQLERPDVQVLILGEAREWETIEYAADAISEGRDKAVIILSHVPSEQAGMDEAARWLRTFIHEVPVQFIPTADPFAADSTLTHHKHQ